MRIAEAALVLILFTPAAFAAPQIESVVVKPSPAAFAGGKPPEVEVAVSVSRPRFGSGNCDARLDFGDGEGRTLDFGVADRRTARHVYRKGGDYRVTVKGAGKTPCEGSREATLSVKGPAGEKKAEKKKAEKKKAEKKKAEKKKADAKSAAKKKDEKKD